MASIKFCAIFCFIHVISGQGVKQIYQSAGDLNIALIISNCLNNSNIKPYPTQTFITSAIWTTQRLNFLKTIAPLSLGLQVYETCSDNDLYKTVFEMYEERDEEYHLGVISEKSLSDKVQKFCDLLQVSTRTINKNLGYLFKATVQFLGALGWIENVTVVAPSDGIVREFYQYTKKEFICLKDCLIYRNNCLPHSINSTGPIVFFGNKDAIELISKHYSESSEEVLILFVPLDGSVPKGLPDQSFVIIPPHEPLLKISTKSLNIHPNPLLFEIATPILSYAETISDFIRSNCNETSYKINCIRNKFDYKKQHKLRHLYSSTKIVEKLEIEPLKHFFVYDIFRVENTTSLSNSELAKRNNFFQPYNKLFVYNIFNNNLTMVDGNYEINFNNTSLEDEHPKKCFSAFNRDKSRMFDEAYLGGVEASLNIRTDSWVFAFLSLSLLGVAFCLAVLIFLLLSICNREVLEGNPMLSIALLLAVMLLFCSVLPFSFETHNKSSRDLLCFAKALSVTLSYALTFSLVLSRCILLATSAKDIGFMSHIAGPVQSFLCLFIFGVQAALSLQVIGRCVDIFRGYAFLYLMSYNAMLLLLLCCLCPLIYQCERNYREGKYFTIATGLITIIWCVWVPGYAVLDAEWREPLLCFGLVASGAVFLGAVFIPRTYLMTIASAREKITSALPSLATATSTMDIYRANTQPVYDCVNVAAINAVTVARASAPNMHHPDLYSCPAMPEDEGFDFRCDTPIDTDKVTRF